MPESHLTRPVLLSISAAVVTIGLKTVAFYLTGSVGLLSEAAESGINLLTAITAYFSLWYAALPADRTHTYGHAKIEYFSSGLEGFMILAAAAGIAAFGIHRLIEPEHLRSLDIGVAIAAVSAIINLIVARTLLRAGRRHQSIVLEADGRHLMTDVWTTAGVLMGLVLVWLSGKVWDKQLLWIDPVIALVMSGNIAWTGISLLWLSFKGLMDHALPPAELAAMRKAIEAQLGPNMTYHALRTRLAGSLRFADCHLLVPGNLTVSQAHDVANRIEDAVRLAVPGVEVTVHIEPIEEESAYRDSAMLRVEEEETRKLEEKEKTGSDRD
jgi:cation diffusion facilitator family transporter